MTTPIISSVVLGQVRAYAAEVRAHLGDLPPDQVEDLTDGLEADLAEALADAVGPVATGEVSRVGAAGDDTPEREASLLDLARRFGPSSDYAAELRASAGLEEPGAAVTAGRHRPHAISRAVMWALAAAGRVTDAAAESVRPVADTPAGRTLAGLAALLRPLWWVVRGWLWFVLLRRALEVAIVGGFPPVEANQLVPTDPGGWLFAVVAMLASLEIGRRAFARGAWQRRTALALSGLSVLALPWAVSTAWGWVGEVQGGSVQYVPYEVEVEVPVEADDGVYVDGTLVSNLFVYDAEGNPLQRVQVFDDRGRPVRTTYDDGSGLWSMPGVTEPWRFASAVDVDGRDRWNVYPLMGAPGAAWIDGEGGPVLMEGEALRTPPPPFAKAPALVEPTQ